MCENVNINVSETNETINIVATEVQEVIDINVFETAEDVTLNITEQLIQVNVNKVTAAEQIQSDWAQTDNEALDFIKNKPTVPTNTSDLINDGEDGVNPFITANDIPPVTGFVPYTGATEDVNLGEFGLLTGNVEFDNTPTNIPTTAGAMYWNDADGTTDLILKGGNVKLQVGQESVIRVVNKTATNINLLEANYQAVRVTGAQGQRLKVDLAQATTDNLSAETIGLVTETINNNQEGFITTSGLVRNINTTGSLQGETWADGDILYLSPTTAGNVTKVKPTAPNHLVIIGYVVHAHANQGSIFVKVDNGYELDELHNVKITSAANNNVLAYTSATDIWENKTVETALGYTPFQLPSLTSGSVLFSNGTTIAQDNSNLFWDDTNNRLGIGTNAPTNTLDVNGTARVQNVLTINKGGNNFFTLDAGANGSDLVLRFFKSGVYDNTLSTRNPTNVGGFSVGNGLGLNGGFLATTVGSNSGLLAVTHTTSNAQVHIAAPQGFSSYVSFRENNVANLGLIGYQNGTTYFQVRVNGATTMTTGTMSTAFFNSGNVGINTTTDAGFRLDVNGTARVQGNFTQSVTGTASLGFITNGNGSYSNAPASSACGMIIGTVSNGGHTAIFTKGNNSGATALRVTDQNIGTSVNHFLIDFVGSAGFGLPNGTLFTDASARVQIDSTTKGFLPPRMTTTQKNAIATPAAGLVVYDTTLGKLCVRTAAAWETITSL